MAILHAVAEDLVNALDSDELVEMFGLSPAGDLAEQLVAWWDHKGDSTPEKLSASLSADFGRYCVREVLKHLRLTFDKNASVEVMIDQWFQHRQLEITRPFVRPQELAATITELADQIHATPDKFESIDVLINRCCFLLRYIALFYAPELVSKECFKALLDECGASPGAADLVPIIESMSFDQLCRAVSCDAPVKAEPYAKFGDGAVELAASPVEALLAALAPNAGAGERDEHAKKFSAAAAALVEQWQRVIPKGAVMLEYRRSDKLLEAVCVDEFNRRLTVSGIRAAMDNGDNVLLAVGVEERVPAPNIKPVPKGDAWITPGRSSCGLAEISREAPAAGPKQVFISYCREDSKWADRVRIHLKPFHDARKIRLWDDQRIKTGDWWNDEIESALHASKLAVLIVSADFYASDYVAQKELPVLLKAARERRVRLFPLFVDAVVPESQPEVARLQAANSLDRALNELSEAEQERWIAKLAGEIIKYAS